MLVQAPRIPLIVLFLLAPALLALPVPALGGDASVNPPAASPAAASAVPAAAGAAKPGKPAAKGPKKPKAPKNPPVTLFTINHK